MSPADSSALHNLTCARNLREQLLAAAGSPAPAPPQLGALIAAEIQKHCGHQPLKCLRLSRGWPVEQAVRALQTLADELGPRAGQLTPRSWKQWETGAAAPTPHNLDLLCRLFETGPVQLGYGRDYTPTTDQGTPQSAPAPGILADDGPAVTPKPPGENTNRRHALKAVGFTATQFARPRPSISEALSLTMDLERTDLGPHTLHQIERQIDLFAHTYAMEPAEIRWGPVREMRHYTHQLLHGRHTLPQKRQLIHHAGMLSVILGWLAHDLDRPDAALAYATDAHAHSQAGETDELAAWADDLTTTVYLYTNQTQRALQHSQRGLATAPPRSAAHLRLAAQNARSLALAGQADSFPAARRAAHKAAKSYPTHVAGLFSADQARLQGFDASSYLALGNPTEAREAAADALTLYAGADATSPTRAAIAQLDLAAAEAALGNNDSALDYATQALSGPRPASAITHRAKTLARTLHTHHPTQALSALIGRIETLSYDI